MPRQKTLDTLKGRSLRDTHPYFDAKKKRDLERNRRLIAAARKKSALGMWAEGRAFSEIRDRKLFIQDGYSSMERWVKEVLKRSYSWVKELMRFADSFTLEQVEEHHDTKLKLGEKYARLTATDRDDKAWSIESVEVSVPVDDAIVRKPFDETTEPELEAAIAHQQELARDRADSRVTPEQRQRAELYNKGLADEFEGTGIRARVHVRPARNGNPGAATFALEVPYEFASRALKKLASMRP